MASDFEGTIAKVAAIGYSEIEPTSYNNMSPREFRAMLDRYKLTMASTHIQDDSSCGTSKTSLV
jgi:sugar phosphate isomerase/epimerase